VSFLSKILQLAANINRPNDQTRSTRTHHGRSRIPGFRNPDLGIKLLLHNPSRSSKCSQHSRSTDIPNPLPNIHSCFHSSSKSHRSHTFGCSKDQCQSSKYPPSPFLNTKLTKITGIRSSNPRRPLQHPPPLHPTLLHPPTLHFGPRSNPPRLLRPPHLRRLPALRRPGRKLQRPAPRSGVSGNRGLY
jgi:hypothetical protein